MSTFRVVNDSSHSYLTREKTRIRDQVQQNSSRVCPGRRGRLLPVWAPLTDLLVGKRSSQHLTEHGGVAQGFQSLVQTVHQRVEKLQGVVLLAQVHRFAPQSKTHAHGFFGNCYNTELMQSFFKVPELFPEAPGDIVLQPRRGQMSKNDLEMPQYPDVVLLPVL